MITTEDKVFMVKLRVQMLELAEVSLRCLKRFGNPVFREGYEFYYQQARELEDKIKGVK